MIRTRTSTSWGGGGGVDTTWSDVNGRFRAHRSLGCDTWTFVTAKLRFSILGKFRGTSGALWANWTNGGGTGNLLSVLRSNRKSETLKGTMQKLVGIRLKIGFL